ncbi:hypothetical protein CFC21_066827 [Triticum aestivum]|uniref:Uncharacterized protein n=3 Tax=Triticum TaxID=4564 RepID=A0A3B6KLY3_WHEAT|nr:hypothetical protein CFC21_066827 [Triticum aestivum]
MYMVHARHDGEERLPPYLLSFTCMVSCQTSKVYSTCVHAPPNKTPKAHHGRLTYVRRQSQESQGQIHPIYAACVAVADRRLTSNTLSSSQVISRSLTNMCSSASWNSSPPAVLFIRQQGKKKPHVSVTLRRKRLRLIRRRRRELRRAAAGGAEMAMLNLRLHLENRRILAENERLRERAGALRRENLALHANLCKVVLPPAEAAPGC